MPNSERRRPSWLLPAATFAAALAVRAWVLMDEQSGNPLFRRATLDDDSYLRLAASFASGDPPRAWFLAPLYPWVLGFVGLLAQPTMAVAGWLSACVGATTAAVAAVVARRVHSDAAGWIAGALTAGAGVLVFHDVLPGQEPLLALLHVATLWLAVRCAGDEAERRGTTLTRSLTVASAGLVVGVAMLGRATSVVLAFAFVLVACRGLPLRRAAGSFALLALGSAAVLLPAALRNASVCGEFTPLPWSGGPNLYMANGPDSRRLVTYGSIELGMRPDVMERRATEIAEASSSRTLRPGEVSAWWVRRTWEERGGAGELATHAARKALLFWSSDEFGSSHDIVVERRWSGWLRFTPVGSWWLLALGAAGWWLARRRSPALDFVAATVLLTWIALTVYFPVSRYRLPVLPLLAVAAACGVAEAAAFRPTGRRLAWAATLGVAATAAAFVPLREDRHATGWNNVAAAAEAEGDRQLALALLRRAEADEPGDGPVLERLGRLLVEEKRPAEAIECFSRAEADARTQWTAGIPAIRAYVDIGRPDTAEKIGVVLAARDQSSPRLRAELFANWALAAATRGDRAAAEQRLRLAETLDRGHPAVAFARARMR